METIVGIFNSRGEGEKAVAQLEATGIPRDRITLLTPAAKEQLADVRTTEAEQPGMGKALGATVGGALGVAGGLPIGAAIASFFVPGVGPIIAAGLVGAALLGFGGAATGAAAGEAMEEGIAHGLPHDELFVYEDALRKGRTVVLAFAEDEEVADRGRGALAQAGAESIDAARENWWIGLRSAEQEHYQGAGGDLDKNEALYRRGFEAALHPGLRHQPYQTALPTLREKYADAYESETFKTGYLRGQDYDRSLKEKIKE
ncbi:MAG: hypothetical protein QOE77_3747 [Blastocatellia bacterium]|jgi:hypothetical protein|nr:hypothetical protein [Blastocatellia bacterium]